MEDTDLQALMKRVELLLMYAELVKGQNALLLGQVKTWREVRADLIDISE
ncbi:DUF904 domain-containing protein, partial [Pseudomonas syringae pv. tagetis]